MLLVTICATADGIALDCSFEITTFPVIGSFYTCTGRVLHDGNENVTFVYGIQETGKGHEDVRALRLRNQSLQFFLTNIESFSQIRLRLTYGLTVTDIGFHSQVYNF